jgi:hypothetical protein
MPFRYTIDKQLRLVVCKGWGVLTKNELLAFRHQLRSDPNFDESFWRLVDLTEVTDIQVPTDEISFWSQFNTASPNVRRAIVANPAFFPALARLYEMMRRNSGDREELTKVFEDLPPARQWLGLDDTLPRPR